MGYSARLVTNRNTCPKVSSVGPARGQVSAHARRTCHGHPVLPYLGMYSCICASHASLGGVGCESNTYLGVSCCMRDTAGKRRHCTLRFGNKTPIQRDTTEKNAERGTPMNATLGVGGKRAVRSTVTLTACLRHDGGPHIAGFRVPLSVCFQL